MSVLRPRGIFHVTCLFNGVVRWKDVAVNAYMTQGRNDLLDKYLNGSAYTSAFYFGLISSVGWTGTAITDTAAQINGTNQWKEAGPTSAPNYTEATRPAAVWTAGAAGGAKTVASASSFTMSAIGTLKGIFMITNSTKDGTSGVLCCAGTFSGGDKVTAIGEIVLVSYTLTLS